MLVDVDVDEWEKGTHPHDNVRLAAEVGLEVLALAGVGDDVAVVEGALLALRLQQLPQHASREKSLLSGQPG